MKFIYIPLLKIQGIAINTKLVLISKSRKGDIGLAMHEMMHVEQMKRCGTLTWWKRYLTSREHRLNYEAEAYALSVRFSSHENALDYYSNILFKCYLLNISLEKAKDYIQRYYK